jgi:hypothetical protein
VGSNKESWRFMAENMSDGTLRIGSLDEAGRSAIRDRLYTAGELLRLNQIAPDDSKMVKLSPKQLDLFAEQKRLPLPRVPAPRAHCGSDG